MCSSSCRRRRAGSQVTQPALPPSRSSLACPAPKARETARPPGCTRTGPNGTTCARYAQGVGGTVPVGQGWWDRVTGGTVPVGRGADGTVPPAPMQCWWAQCGRAPLTASTRSPWCSVSSERSCRPRQRCGPALTARSPKQEWCGSSAGLVREWCRGAARLALWSVLSISVEGCTALSGSVPPSVERYSPAVPLWPLRRNT